MFISSRFNDLLKLIPRDAVNKFSQKHGTDRWSKSFKSWDHLVAMLAGQLGGVSSLRELEVMFQSQQNRLYHLHCNGVKRSTLSDANIRRDPSFFSDIANLLVAQGTKHKHNLRTLLYVLDSSPIILRGRGLKWGEASHTRTCDGGLKLHAMMTPADGMLHYVSITDMNVNDISDAQTMSLQAGRIYLFDKGYCDYNWWYNILEIGSHFVTRIKRNAAYRTVETRSIKEEDKSFILSDKVIELTNKTPRSGKLNRLAGTPLRLIEIPHPGGKKTPFLIVSSLLNEPAEKIAEAYKQRWQIELLFKWIKQNLKIKRFMGESRNAILIQIYVAIIAYLLLHAYNKLMGANAFKRLKDLIIDLRCHLFHPRSIIEHPPPDISSQQGELWKKKR